MKFLFAVVRDVQRNDLAVRTTLVAKYAVSIRCRARRTAELVSNYTRAARTGFYSLSCETYSGTRCGNGVTVERMFLFAVVRDVQRNGTQVSTSGSVLFLFAVVRDVQRNPIEAGPEWGHYLATRFYSLSCETYSGTFLSCSRKHYYAFGGFYSLSCETYSGTDKMDDRRGRHGGFYSLSCETYSGTTVSTSRSLSRIRPSFYSLSCETYSGTVHPDSVGADDPGFYSLSCETYSGTL